jgi:hypothetical protein
VLAVTGAALGRSRPGLKHAQIVHYSVDHHCANFILIRLCRFHARVPCHQANLPTMSFLSRTPMTAERVIEEMHVALYELKYGKVVELRKRFGDDRVDTAGPSDKFWLNALPCLASMRWGISLGTGGWAMMSATGAFAWLAGCQEPPNDRSAQELWREIERLVADPASRDGRR